ncbi:MAG: serine/threonine-protein phosphatase [Solirubrobacteraceae bacterium]|nr:serine/threonine-protein phosphatase [Solirubrobacteraceae bacterium]
MQSAPAGLVSRIAERLPHGGTIDDEHWNARHHVLTLVVWAHVPALLITGLLVGASVTHSVVDALVVVPFALLAQVDRFPRRARAILVTLGLLTSSAALVHLTDGLIESHFHFFVVVAVLAFYEDWAVYGVAVLYVLAHHGIAGTIEPEAVFGTSHSGEPWRWAAVHSAFIFAAAAVSILMWGANERTRGREHEHARARRDVELEFHALVDGLVPDEVPSVPGAEVATMYMPGSGSVGGDFYEVLALEEGRMAVVVGDVMGHGPKAAALGTEMRHVARSCLLDGLGTAATMYRLDRCASSERTATAVVLILEPAEGRIRWCRAGHVPAVICERSGSRTLLGAGNALLIGEGGPFTEHQRALPAGGAVAAFTDGVIERRGRDVLQRIDRLADAMWRLSPLELVVQARAALAADPERDDDAALVVVRLIAEPGSDAVDASASGGALERA